MLAFLTLLPFTASANVTYHYTGAPYELVHDESIPSGTYTTGMRISGWIELAVPLPPLLALTEIDPLSFSFNDGRGVLSSPADLGSFKLQTDGGGNIVAWSFAVINLLSSVGTGLQMNMTSFYLPDEAVPGLDRVFQASLVRYNVIGYDGADSHNPLAPQYGTWSVSPVPEPKTTAMLLAGLGLLAFMVRRRTNAGLR
jgi:hypothetical protein